MPHRTHSFNSAANLALFVLLSIASSAEFARAQGDYSSAFWSRDPVSPGSWFDAANWNPGPPGPLASATIDNGGTAVISAGHAEALAGWIGFNNNGALRITGGSAVFQWQLSLGYMPDARGELHIDGGALSAAGGLLVGAGGHGEVTQTGGAVDAPQLTLGNHIYFFPFRHFTASPVQPEDYGRGHYRLAGGNLQTAFATVGNAGVGRFIQDGGRAEVANTLRIGGQIAELPDLTRPPLFLGDDLPLHRVTHDPVPLPADSSAPSQLMGVINDYWFPPLVPSRGLYELNDGELVGGNLLVDRTGTYRQTGGTSDFDFVAINDEGQFRLRGGELHAEHGFHSDEPLDLNSREVTLSVGAGILDLSGGIAGAKNAHIAAGPDSLTILPSGFNPNTGFGTFNRQGMVHVAGNDLVVPAGKRIAGAGVIDDFVTARGEFAAASYGINLTKGLRLLPGADVDLGDGALAAVGRATTFQGGDLAARQLVVGGTLADPWHGQFQNNGYWRFNDPQFADAPGVIRHAAGDVQIAQRATVLSGAYRISGGELDAEMIDVGVNQWYGEQEEIAARFVQTGGTVRTSNLTLSQTYVYPLAFDGTHGIPDLQHHGAFEFAAATNDDIRIEPPTDHLTIAPFIGPTAIHASYRLEAGELIADRIYLSQSWGDGSTTRFLQTGGSVVSNNRINMHGPNTNYLMDGGQLTARRIEIGAQFVLTNPEYVVPDSATFAVRDSSSQIEIRGELLFGGGSQFRAVPGTTIRMTNPEPAPEGDWQALPASSFRNLAFDSDDLSGLKNLTLVFDGHTNEASTFEVAGRDLGPGPAGYQHNFALAGLTLGGDSPASLQLTDFIDNQRNGDFNEALYVDTLIVGPGSTLDIGSLNLYYRHAEIAGTVLSSTGSLLAATQVPEPAAATMALGATLALAVTTRRRA